MHHAKENADLSHSLLDIPGPWTATLPRYTDAALRDAVDVVKTELIVRDEARESKFRSRSRPFVWFAVKWLWYVRF